MSAFNTNMFGFASVAAASSGAESTLNDVIQYLDALRGPLLIDSVVTSTSATISVSDGDEGRFWLWNNASGYNGTDAALLALNNQVGGFARGSLLWYTHGGWAYYNPALDSANRYLLAVLLNTAGFDGNDAFLAASSSSNRLYQRNRTSGDSPVLLMFDDRGPAIAGQWGNQNGWQIIGGTETNQPLGWYGDPDVLNWSPSGSASVNVGAANEMAVGWFAGQLVRKLHVRCSSAFPLNTNRTIVLDHASYRQGTIGAIVGIRCLLNNSSSSAAAGRVEVPVNLPDSPFHVWLDVPNKAIIVRRVADTVSIGGNSWSVSNTTDFNRFEFLVEYASQF